MLRTIIRQLIRTTAGYSLATYVGPLFTLVLTPLYARFLGVEGYGTVDTLSVLGAVFMLLGLLGMNTALPAIYHAPEHAAQQQRIIASALLVAVAWSTLLGVFVVVFAAPLTRLTLARNDITQLTQLIGVGVPFAVIYNLQLVVLRLRFAVWRANLLALLYLAVSAAANLVFVVWLGWGGAGAITASTTVNIAMGLLSLVVAHESARAWPSWALVQHAVRLGLPLVPAAAAVWVLAYEDRLFLVRAVTLEQIGMYAIAIKLASMVGILVEPFKSAWAPLALSIQGQTNAPRAYAKVLNYFAVGSLGLALALSLFAHEVLLVFTTRAYIGAADYVWLLVLVPLFSVLQWIVAVGLLIEQRLATMSWTIFVSALVNTVLNIVLIPYVGVWGAVIATVVACFVAPLLSARAAQRIHPLPFEWRRASAALVVYLLLAGAGVFVGSQLTALSLALRGALLAAYLPLLWVLGVFELWELQLARRALRQPQMVLRWVTGRT